ncbi:MAG: HepT-like ribonuclease domain-containing protein [Longimicrobiales bacterium]
MASAPGKSKVLGTGETLLLVQMAGYRNRMVHFYHRIEPPNCMKICAQELGDIDSVREALRTWIASRPIS